MTKMTSEDQFNRLTCCNVCSSKFSAVVQLKRKRDGSQRRSDLFNHHSLWCIHLNNHNELQQLWTFGETDEILSRLVVFK